MSVADSIAAEVDNFRYQAAIVRSVVATNVQGLTHADSVIQPRPGGNSLNWIMGHLVWAYEQALPLFGQDAVLEKGVLDRYARGAPGLASPAEAVNFEDLLAAWNVAAERVDAGLSGLTPDVLARKASASPTMRPSSGICSPASRSG